MINVGSAWALPTHADEEKADFQEPRTIYTKKAGKKKADTMMKII